MGYFTKEELTAAIDRLREMMVNATSEQQVTDIQTMIAELQKWMDD